MIFNFNQFSNVVRLYFEARMKALGKKESEATLIDFQESVKKAAVTLEPTTSKPPGLDPSYEM